MSCILTDAVLFSDEYINHFQPWRIAELAIRYNAVVVLPTLLWPFMITNSFLYLKYSSSFASPVSRPISMLPWEKSSIHLKSSSSDDINDISPSLISILRLACFSSSMISRIGVFFPFWIMSTMVFIAWSSESNSRLVISLNNTRTASSSSIRPAAM